MALLYMLLAAVAPRVQVVSALLASGLLFWQALYFNRILVKFGQIDDRSLMPAALYVVLGNLCFDFGMLSAPLVALTVLVPVLSRLFTHIRFGQPEAKVHESGVLIGIAALIYWPSVFYIFFLVLCMLLYTGMPPRWYAVLGIGFLLPLMLAGFTFYFFDALDGFATCYLRAPLTLAKTTYASFGMLTVLMAIPLSLTVWAALRTVAHRGFINFQVVSHTVMIIWAGAGAIGYPFATCPQPACLWLLVPAGADFLAQWSYLIQKARLRELLLTALLAHTLLVFYLPYLPLTYLRTEFLKQGLVVFSKPNPIQNKRIWVSGPKVQLYLGNTPSTPFLDNRLAASMLEDTTDYAVRFRVYQAFLADMPEVIIDNDGHAAQFLSKMPVLARAYAHQGKSPYWFQINQGSKQPVFTR
jgi:hypothetical protein